jgi:sodium-dependent dicarboxylate transporter 2/3/5
MAFVAGAGSIVTLLGAARGAVALGFYKEITGRDVTFFELSWYMFPIGWVMVFVLWGFFMIYYKPEQATIPGLRERAKDLYAQLGGITGKEILAATIVVSAVATMSLRSFIPALKAVDKSGIIMLATLLFFVFKILDISDLEDDPVEHHPAVRRRHEPRLLPGPDRGGRLDGRSTR